VQKYVCVCVCVCVCAHMLSQRKVVRLFILECDVRMDSTCYTAGCIYLFMYIYLGPGSSTEELQWLGI
jgi:hypothetical protein